MQINSLCLWKIVINTMEATFNLYEMSVSKCRADPPLRLTTRMVIVKIFLILKVCTVFSQSDSLSLSRLTYRVKYNEASQTRDCFTPELDRFLHYFGNMSALSAVLERFPPHSRTLSQCVGGSVKTRFLESWCLQSYK